MKKTKTYWLFGLSLFFGASMHAQEKIQDLNAVLNQSGGNAILSTSTSASNQQQANSTKQLRKTFFDAHGVIAVVNRETAVKWDRVDKPVQDLVLKSVSEIPKLKQAYKDQFYLIRTIKVDYSDNIDSVAELAADMPNLQNILITSYQEMPQNINDKLAGFLAKLKQSQVHPVNVYYYQESQPQ